MASETLLNQIRSEYEASPDRAAFVAELRSWISRNISTTSTQPVDLIRWVPIEKVTANDYNPNSVAKNEMRLLYVSILHDGYTQPVVTIYDKDSDKYVIVDGFHRYTTMRLNQDIRDRCNGLLPVVVIDKPINDRMASTIRHNRARGKHSISGMSNMVFQMLDNGWSDEDICKEIGCEPDELIRLKHVTGFSKLFENVDYRRAWESKTQILIRKKWEEQNASADATDRNDQAVLEESPGESGDD